MDMNDVTIWRYVDFTKFADLISTEEVFFCRSDLLGDPFEGSSPRKHREKQIEEIREAAEDFERELALYECMGQNFRKYIYINCWHMSEYESAALWQLYLKSDEGIAIRSTRNRLGHSFCDSEPGVFTVPVMYIDYAADDPPVPTRLAPYRYKRKSFEHERELRAMVFPFVDGEVTSAPERGVRVKCKLTELIDAVVVAPTAPDWFYNLTVHLCEHFGVAANVLRSSIASEKPDFI